MEDNQEIGTATEENVEAAAQAEEVKQPETQDKKTDSAEKDSKKEKLFTQDEVNKMISDRVERMKKQPSEETGNLQKTVEILQNQLAQYEKELAQSKFDIKPEFVEFVDYKVSRMVNEEVNYEKALAEYMRGEGQIYLGKKPAETPAITMTRPENVGKDDEKASYESMMAKAMKI